MIVYHILSHNLFIKKVVLNLEKNKTKNSHIKTWYNINLAIIWMKVYMRIVVAYEWMGIKIPVVKCVPNISTAAQVPK